ncbi:MAG: ABC transporter substrate-binding protein, partial [Chloroflexi bacterium]|nr:ABC transporter substrate-binding protein [Chloroflexota bacterium]
MRRKSSFAVLWIMVVIALIGCSAAPAPKPEAPKAAEPAKAVEAPKPAVAPKATEPSKPAATPAAAKEAAKPKAEAAKPKAQPVTVRVSSMAGSITDFPTTEAAKKFGDKYSVIMDVVAAQRPNDQIAALVGGSLDIVFVAPDVVVRAVAGGGKIKIIGARQDAPAWSLVSSKNITKPDQLKGKVVGASELKGSTTVMLRKLLEKLGLKSNDYDLVVVG